MFQTQSTGRRGRWPPRYVREEANGARWPSRSSKPVAALLRGQAGFDSQAFDASRAPRVWPEAPGSRDRRPPSCGLASGFDDPEGSPVAPLDWPQALISAGASPCGLASPARSTAASGALTGVAFPSCCQPHSYNGASMPQPDAEAPRGRSSSKTNRRSASCCVPPRPGRLRRGRSRRRPRALERRGAPPFDPILLDVMLPASTASVSAGRSATSRPTRDADPDDHRPRRRVRHRARPRERRRRLPAKPFGVRELMARITRGHPASRPLGAGGGAGDLVSAGGLTLDRQRRRLAVRGARGRADQTGVRPAGVCSRRARASSSAGPRCCSRCGTRTPSSPSAPLTP